MPRLSPTWALVLAVLAALPADAAATARRASSSGAVLIGPRLAVAGDRVLALWIEEPKTLVVAELDARGGVGARRARPLPEPDARVVQLEPFVLDGGEIAVAILEADVRREGEPRPLWRLSVRWLDRPDRGIELVAMAPDDGSGVAPAAIIGAGAYTPARLPSVVWRRRAPESMPEAPGVVVVSILRGPGKVSESDLLGDSRSATAVGWRADGAAFVAASDAGRPFVVGPDGESPIEVPTPAYVSSLVPEHGPGRGFAAAGLDGSGHVFLVTGSAGAPPIKRFMPAESPLMQAPPEVTDAGAPAGAPLLLPVGEGLVLAWPARRDEDTVELRARRLGWGDVAGRPSVALAACPAGSRLLAWDVAPAGEALVAAFTCAARGRADVHVARSPRLP